jgi:hypothetical protein
MLYALQEYNTEHPVDTDIPRELSARPRGHSKTVYNNNKN